MSEQRTESKTLVVHQGGRQGTLMALRPQTLQEAMELAGYMAKSDLVPKEYRGKPENVLIAMQLGGEVGLSPFQALQSIAVINGRPQIYGDAGLAIVMNSGLLEDFEETDDPAVEGGRAYCRMKRKGVAKPTEHTYSQQDAQGVTMWERDQHGNPRQTKLADRAMWKSFPKRMRQMRARWWVMRDLFPDVLKGLVGREEHEPDATPIPPTDGEVIEVTDYSAMMPRERVAEAPSDVESAVTEPVQPEAESAAAPPPEPPPVAAPPPPPPAPAPAVPKDTPAAPGVPKDKDRPTTFTLNGVPYRTAGVGEKNFLEILKLCAKVDKLKGAKYSANLLLKEFEIQTRVDLTEEMAERFLVRLNEILES